MVTKSSWYKWGYYKHGSYLHVIRRYRKLDGKIIWQSYPKRKYQTYNIAEIEALIRRLNASREAEEIRLSKVYDFHHAFIHQGIIGEFERKLYTRINSKEHIGCVMGSLRQYILKFFVHEKLCPNPDEWKKLETEFGHFLLNYNLSVGYISRIVQTANRFLKFLHEKYPSEIRPLKLDPISSHVLKHRLVTSSRARKKFIDEVDFQIMLKNVTPSLLPPIQLGYYFGLRRSEVLGLSPEDVFQDCLQASRQLKCTQPAMTYTPLKNKDQRLIPYWYTSPQQVYELILKMEKVHPDTLSDMFRKEMHRLNFEYQFHDFRRTWITRSLRKYHFLDVRLAAGHRDLETTQKYIQDDRKLNRVRFAPEAG